MAHKLIDFRSQIPRHPTRKWKTRLEASHIFIHCTASDNQDPKKVAQYHITSGPQNHLSRYGAPSIAYHDFIDKQGVIYHCNNYTDITWHTKGSNNIGIGIAMAFRGQDQGALPTNHQWLALLQHVTVLCLYLKILPKNVLGHREARGFSIFSRGSIRYKKECPGMAVDLNQLRAEITVRLQKRLNAERLYHGKIDGIFGKKSQAALMAFQPSLNRIPNLTVYSQS